MASRTLRMATTMWSRSIFRALPVDRARVEAIHEVSHIMGVKTVAEWVENGETADVLRKIGIDYA